MLNSKTKAMDDKIIAKGVMGDSIVAVNSLAAAVSAASNPDVKRLFKDYLQDAITSLDEIQTYVADKGWVKPFDAPEQQLQMALEDADSIIALKV